MGNGPAIIWVAGRNERPSALGEQGAVGWPVLIIKYGYVGSLALSRRGKYKFRWPVISEIHGFGSFSSG